MSRLLSRRAVLRIGALGTIGAVVAACTGELPGLGPRPSVEAVPPSAPAGSVATPTPPDASAPAGEPDLRTRIAQMLLVGFRGLTVQAASATVHDIADLGLGGVVLFDHDQPTGGVRNIAGPEQVRELVAGLQEASRHGASGQPLLVAIDQEGGHVARLGPTNGFSASPSAAELGAADDAAATRRVAGGMAAEEAWVGVTLNLAPVVDLEVNPANPIIGALGRSFGADPNVVVRQATAFIDGHHDRGVACAIKHFPGHGSSTGDTHLGVVDVTDTWSERELAPFFELTAAGLPDAVLTAHVFNARLDADHPATLSRATIQGVLRNQLGWDGVVISDDMQMGAIRGSYGYDESVRLAIDAGVDVLTIANQQIYEPGIVERTIDSVAGMVSDGRLDQARIDEAYRRVTRLKRGLA